MRDRALEKYRIRNPVEGPPCPAATVYVVIPAYREADTIGGVLESLALDGRSLAVVVVNQEEGDDGANEPNERTAAVAAESERVVVLDRFRPGSGFASGRGGAGAARRVGMDYVVRHARPDDLIVSLDADSPVDAGFIDAVLRWREGREERASRPPPTETTCGLIEFEHELPDDPDHHDAMVSYETWLRYFALALAKAGSPYAHVSLGCRIVCTVDAYVRVAGMPRRSAAEDFYFLQKLVKAYGPLPTIRGALVRPSSRASSRVPFGTGPAVSAILGGTANYDLVEPPAAFYALRELLSRVDDLWLSDAPISDLPATVRELLAALDVKTNLARLRRNHVDERHFRRAFHQWFDALRTNQLVRRIAESEGRIDCALAVEEVTGVARNRTPEERLWELRGSRPPHG